MCLSNDIFGAHCSRRKSEDSHWRIWIIGLAPGPREQYKYGSKIVIAIIVISHSSSHLPHNTSISITMGWFDDSSDQAQAYNQVNFGILRSIDQLNWTCLCLSIIAVRPSSSQGCSLSRAHRRCCRLRGIYPRYPSIDTSLRSPIRLLGHTRNTAKRMASQNRTQRPRQSCTFCKMHPPLFASINIPQVLDWQVQQ